MRCLDAIRGDGKRFETIAYLTRHLINVLWDNRLSLNVFPRDIEIINDPGSREQS